MDQLNYLKQRAAVYFKGLNTVLATLNRDHQKPNTRWEIDETTGKVRRVKLPSLEWEKYDEPNDPLFDDEDNEQWIQENWTNKI